MMDDSRQNRAQGRIGKTVKGKWRIDARLGEGATATVYAATHRNGHRVALKVLHPQFSRDEQIRTRFLREAYVANAVEHPGIVRVLDDDISEDGAVFLVMELLEGESLERRCERLGGRLPWGEVVWLLDKLLEVLAAAHDKNVIHRDIKPDNVFLTASGQLKVLDFGFARMKEEASKNSGREEAPTLTKTGFILGTPDFMSPEQAGGRNNVVDSRSDLWAAAASAFYLISGQRVHAGTQTLHQHLVQTATKRARSLGLAAPEVPASIVDVIDRALSLEQDRRWTDARSMRKALSDAAGMLGPRVSAPEIEDGDSTIAYSREQVKIGNDPYDDALDTVAQVDPRMDLPSSRRGAGTGSNKAKYNFDDQSVVFVGGELPQLNGSDTQEEMPTTVAAFSPPMDSKPPPPMPSPPSRSPRDLPLPPPPSMPRPVVQPQIPLGLAATAPDHRFPVNNPMPGPAGQNPNAPPLQPPNVGPGGRFASGLTTIDANGMRWLFVMVVMVVLSVILIVGMARRRRLGPRHLQPTTSSSVQEDGTEPPEEESR
jgi:serine/threonine protein kinase